MDPYPAHINNKNHELLDHLSWSNWKYKIINLSHTMPLECTDDIFHLICQSSSHFSLTWEMNFSNSLFIHRIIISQKDANCFRFETPVKQWNEVSSMSFMQYQNHHEFYAISKSSWVLCNIKTLSLIKHQTLVHSFLKLNINKKYLST